MAYEYKFVGKEPIYQQVNEYMKFCKNVKHLAPGTITVKGLAYSQFIKESGCSDLRLLTNEHINTFIEKQTRSDRKLPEGKVSAGAVNVRLTHLKTMVTYFRENGMEIPVRLSLIPRLKEREVRRQRVFYSREQIEAVLAGINLKARDPHVRRDNTLDWLLIKFCFDGGLRISELQSLELSSLTGRRLNFMGKGSKPGEVYITEQTYRVFKRWVEMARIEKWLWVDERGNRLCVNSLRTRMRKVFFAAGLYDFHPHALRHSFCTDLSKRGATLLEMQQMMRHQNAQTTERYNHGFEGREEALFEKFHPSKVSCFYQLRLFLAKIIAPKSS